MGIMGKQCWNQAVLESGSWGHSVLQTPALVFLFFFFFFFFFLFFFLNFSQYCCEASIINNSNSAKKSKNIFLDKNAKLYLTIENAIFGP